MLLILITFLVIVPCKAISIRIGVTNESVVVDGGIVLTNGTLEFRLPFTCTTISLIDLVGLNTIYCPFSPCWRQVCTIPIPTPWSASILVNQSRVDSRMTSSARSSHITNNRILCVVNQLNYESRVKLLLGLMSSTIIIQRRLAICIAVCCFAIYFPCIDNSH